MASPRAFRVAAADAGVGGEIGWFAAGPAPRWMARLLMVLGVCAADGATSPGWRALRFGEWSAEA